MYQSVGAQARNVAVLLGVSCLVAVVSVWFDAQEVDLAERLLAGESISDEAVAAHESREASIRGVGSAIRVLTAVLFLAWWHRLYANLHALGARDLFTTPGWAVAYFFIPILNLIRPYWIARDIWSECTLRDGRDAQRAQVIVWWWGFWVFGAVTTGIANWKYRSMTRGLQEEALRGWSETTKNLSLEAMEHWREAAIWMLRADVLVGVAAVFAIFAVRALSARQEAKHAEVIGLGQFAAGEFEFELPSLSGEQLEITIPKGSDEAALFDALEWELAPAKKLRREWDALSELLCDLSGTEAQTVVLIHADVPALAADDLARYLDVLAGAVRHWRAHDGHDLVVVFPPGARGSAYFRRL